MATIKALGYKNLVDYVLNNSTLKEDQFTFAMQGGDGYNSFIVAKENKLLFLGEFSYARFIRMEYPVDSSDCVAITKFFDLCIKKLSNKNVKVPPLYGNPETWNPCYRKAKKT